MRVVVSNYRACSSCRAVGRWAFTLGVLVTLLAGVLGMLVAVASR